MRIRNKEEHALNKNGATHKTVMRVGPREAMLQLLAAKNCIEQAERMVFGSGRPDPVVIANPTRLRLKRIVGLIHTEITMLEMELAEAEEDAD